MREFTKSMMSYTWAMSVFGAQQMFNLLTPGQGDPAAKVTESFNNVTDATADTFDGSLKGLFDAGDRLQRGLVDVMFGGFMSAGCDPNRWARMGAEGMQRMGDLGRQATQNAAAGFSGTTAATGTPGSPSPGSTAGAGTSQQSSSVPPQSAGWGPMPGR